MLELDIENEIAFGRYVLADLPGPYWIHLATDRPAVAFEWAVFYDGDEPQAFPLAAGKQGDYAPFRGPAGPLASHDLAGKDLVVQFQRTEPVPESLELTIVLGNGQMGDVRATGNTGLTRTVTTDGGMRFLLFSVEN
jgi:hypothetical protein